MTEKQKMIQWLKDNKYKFREFYFEYDFSGEHVKILKIEEIVVRAKVDGNLGNLYIQNIASLDDLIKSFKSNNVTP
jgi:exopolysaccharide biosynthesis predicted pyruvyltransferase EpsI